MSWFLELAVRATVLLLLGFIVWRLALRVTAEGRCAWLRALLVGLVVLPFASLSGPKWAVAFPWMAKPEPIYVDSTLFDAAAAVTPEGQPMDVWPVALWLALAVAASIPPMIGWNVLRRRWNAGKALSDKTESELSCALLELGVRKPVRARIGCVSSPLVFGAIRPSLLLPKTFTEWPETYRRSALLHEAAHIKRFDCAWLAFAAAIRAVYACHPLVWWLSRALRDETELAADERAIRAGVEATDYASALVAIARDLQLNGKLVRSQGVTFMHHRQLETRVRGALAPKRRGFTFLGSIGLFIAALGSALGIAAIRPQAPEAEIFVIAPADLSLTLAPDKDVNLQVVDEPLEPTIPQATRRPAKAAKAPKAVSKPGKVAKVRAAKAPKAVTTKVWATPSALAPQVTTTWASPVQTTSPALAPLARVGTQLPSADAISPASPIEGARLSTDTLAPLPARAGQDPKEVRGVPLLRDIPVAGFQLGEKEMEAMGREMSNLRQGLSAAEAKQLRELVEKAIREAQAGSEEAKEAVGSLFEARAAQGKAFTNFAWNPKRAAYEVIGKSLSYTSQPFQGAKRVKGYSLFTPVKSTTPDATALKAYKEMVLVKGTRINTTGLSEIVITDSKGKRQVIKIKPGSKKTITLQKDKDGNIRVID